MGLEVGGDEKVEVRFRVDGGVEGFVGGGGEELQPDAAWVRPVFWVGFGRFEGEGQGV